MNKYKNIFIEIINYCNAKCPYCTTFVNSNKTRKIISLLTFSNIIENLLKYNLADHQSIIHLYNWGEPFLHPNLYEIVQIINSYNLKYALSTNASINYKKIDTDFTKNLHSVIYSMSGFSQNSYNKIHGFNFDKIIDNIIYLTSTIRSYNPLTHFKIAYHVYKFNINEIKKCEKFANKLNIEFSPYYALLNDWWQLIDYITNKKNYDKIQNDIFIQPPSEFINYSQDYKYFCQQFENLIIDEDGNLNTCCVLPKNHENFSYGNILDENFNVELIFKKRYTQNICSYCCKSGIFTYVNNFQVPLFYKKSLKQILLKIKNKNFFQFNLTTIIEYLTKYLKKFKFFYVLKEIYAKEQLVPSLLGIFINPFYFSKSEILTNIKKLSKYLHGKILDIGCGKKPYQELFNYKEYIGLELDTIENRQFKNADYYYNGSNFPFENKSFDSAISTCVFEHVFNPLKFLSEVNRVLKINGYFLIIVPFIWDEHEQPYDYGRYTSFGLKFLLEKNGFKVIEHYKTLNDIRFFFQLFFVYLYKKLYTRFTIVNTFLTLILVFPLSLIACLLTIIFPTKSDDLYIDNIFLVQKVSDIDE